MLREPIVWVGFQEGEPEMRVGKTVLEELPEALKAELWVWELSRVEQELESEMASVLARVVSPVLAVQEERHHHKVSLHCPA